MANTQEQEVDGKFLPCSFKFHKFSDRVCDMTINCEIIKMDNCLYLWIGDRNNPKMSDLSFALGLNSEKPIATKIMGSVMDTTSLSMANRLSTKLGKPVYVSFNTTVDNITLVSIENRIQEEFKTHADLLCF